MDTKLGRYQVPEAPEALARLHFRDASVTLKTVDHEPKIAVLDQEDLHKQGIKCSTFIKGGGDPDALGSCTANTVIEALSRILSATEFQAMVSALGSQTLKVGGNVYANTVAAERAAIGFYAGCTQQTGKSDSEWPPTDCGSSGPYMYEYAKKLGYIRTEKIAHGATNIVSLMQADGALLGTTWFNNWFDPDAAGFIDGKGTNADLQAAIKSGVAGGHEIYMSAIEKLHMLPNGQVDAANTIIRLRNHWDPSFADHGSFRMHLSTIVALGNQTDVRQFA